MQQGKKLGERELAVKQEGYKIKIQAPRQHIHTQKHKGNNF